MKKVISALLILTFIFSTIFAVYSEGKMQQSVIREDCSDELLSEIFSEIESELTTEIETETETETTTELVIEKDPITIPAGEYYKGDINGDGLITASDARLVLKFSAQQIQLTERQCVLADANSNKAVNAQDARLVLRMSAKLSGIIKCNDAASASNTTYLSRYDKRVKYVATLSGFSTNIMDEALFSKIRDLENYCSKYKNVVTFYFTDVNNQYYIQYNSSKVYRTQCTVKAPFVKSMLDYMEANNIPLTKTLYLQSHQKWKGHYLSGFRTGTGFTIRELMFYALRYSDNTAYQMLFDHFGSKVLNNNAKKIGASLRLGTYIFGETSAADMTKFFLDIYSYNGKYKNEFFSDLMNSQTSPLIRNGIPSSVKIMRKSGNGGRSTVGYHDCAIVLADTPFVLVIYTSVNSDRNFDKTPFTQIAKKVYSINNSLDFA